MADADVESLQRLPRQRTSAAVVDGGGDHQGYRRTATFIDALDGIDGCLGVQCIKAGLQQQQVHAARYQRLGLFLVGCRHLIEGDAPAARVIHI